MRALTIGFLTLVWLNLNTTLEAAPPTAETELFESKVRPMLVERCIECHGPKKQMAGLRLDTRQGMLEGGDSGPVVVPGKPDASLLIQAIRHSGKLKMPPRGEPMGVESIAALTAWVKAGAPWPDATVAAPSSNEAWKKHWAFQPVIAPPLPTVRNPAWPRTEIDHFILAGLESRQLAPSRPTDRRTLLRRLSFDLIGLPPTPEELTAFVNDQSADAYEKQVERLLASPHYGERWGRHWLDTARYSDTKGYVFQEDRNYPHAWAYRDYVVRSFNEDRPYDRFIIEQLAADRLPLGDDPRPLAAMGFLTVGRRFTNNIHDIIDDRLDTLSRTFLGLTVSCARCHDHKFDPIPIRDYYSLYGVFSNSEEPKELPSIQPKDPNAPRAMVLMDRPQLVEARVFKRGNPQNPGEVVPRQFLGLLSGPQRQPFTQGSGRLELAKAIADARNPLTARVMVNRIWMHHFGHGLVRTPSDFGLRSDPPTHPQLLDWLADRFVKDGWSIKQLHRRIVRSAVYQQVSDTPAELLRADPDNRWLARFPRRRLDFESMRDAVLTTTGYLDRTIGGKPFDLTTTNGRSRRTLYAHIDRQNLPGEFRVFDFASPDAHTAQRFVTTVPQQALFLLNSPFLAEQSRHLVAQPNIDSVTDPAGRIRALYRRVLGREPTSVEVQLGLEFIRSTESPEPLIPSPWSYGVGRWDEKTRTTTFRPLPYWTGQHWQGGPQLPDKELGWVLLNAEGGHPGAVNVEAIRRWTAPADLTLSIRGELQHSPKQGDGVRGRVIHSARGVLGEWSVQQAKKPTRVERLSIKKGETVDFIVDCLKDENHDSFRWTVTLQQQGGPGVWENAQGFRGPSEQPLTPWQQYAQVLLLSNEFAFVD